jgi:hypothetical protein
LTEEKIGCKLLNLFVGKINFSLDFKPPDSSVGKIQNPKSKIEMTIPQFRFVTAVGFSFLSMRSLAAVLLGLVLDLRQIWNLASNPSILPLNL